MENNTLHIAAPVDAARSALLELHRALIVSEQAEYERIHGRVASPGALLNLVTDDPWFAWLKPLSSMIVQMDEALDQDPEKRPTLSADEAAAAAMVAVAARLKKLLPAETPADEFGLRYRAALDRDPDFAFQHARAFSALKTLS